MEQGIRQSRLMSGVDLVLKQSNIYRAAQNYGVNEGCGNVPILFLDLAAQQNIFTNISYHKFGHICTG